MTRQELNKDGPAGDFLQTLDDLQRARHVLFRIVAHNRKVQGAFRAGRGNEEIAGNRQLGAWGENSLFFEPIGKKAGQVKSRPSVRTCPRSLRSGWWWNPKGRPRIPTLIRLRAEDVKTTSAAEDWEGESPSGRGRPCRR